MVDANGAYTAADIDVFRQLDEFDLLMFEQPMAAADLDGLAELQRRHHAGLPRRDGRDPGADRRGHRRGACRIVNLKIQRVGGLGPARAIHDLCHQRGVACWVGSMPELGIGQAFGIHLATLANCKYPTDVEPSARWFVDDYVVPATRALRAGAVHRPHEARPGLPGRPGQAPPLPGSAGRVHGPHRGLMTQGTSQVGRSASRREFLAASAGTALAAAASRPPARRLGSPIIDTHVHLWDLKTSSWPGWPAPPPSTAFLWDDYRQASDGAEHRQGDLHGSGRRSLASRNGRPARWPRSAGAATRPWPPP